MIKLSNFCGIFATVFVTTTIILLASCSQDDDNYDSDMYTMAEMGTRLGGEGGDPGGGGSGTGGGTPMITYNMYSDMGEYQLHFLNSALGHTSLKANLKALTDSAFTQWSGHATFEDKNVQVESLTVEHVNSDTINVYLRFNIEILYKNNTWTHSNIYSCPISSFL